MNDADKLKFHLIDNKGKPCGVFDNAILEYIKEKNDLFFLAGTPYIFTDGFYKADFTGARLKTLIKELILSRFVKSTTITRIFQLFAMDYELQRDYDEINNYPLYWIPFRNGMYDTRTGKLHEHSPKYLCINQIPRNFELDKKHTGEHVERFLRSAMDAEDRKTLLQFLGLCMTRLNFQKFVILRGGRGTGKSVVVKLFEDVIGSRNCSNVPLQRLEEKFHSIQLMGKLLNCCADLSGNPLRTTNTIKLITGGDTLTDSFKGRDLVTFTPYARLLFSCNTVPISLDEKSSALFERIVIIEMDHKPETPDRDLGEKIRQEIPYIIHAAVAELRELLSENKLYESARSKELVSDLYCDSDSVQAYIEDCLIRNVNCSIKTTVLLQKYKDYCEETEREPLSRTRFYANLRTKGYGKKSVHGIEYFCGLELKEEGFLQAEDSEIPFD